MCIAKKMNEEVIRFGTSLGVADLNKDGLMDLVVGEPYAGYHELQYEGGVTVLFGSLGEGGTEIGSSDAGVGWKLVEGWKVRCVETPCALGTSMTSTEVRSGGCYVRQELWLGHPMLAWGDIRGVPPWLLIRRWKLVVCTQYLETSTGCLEVKALR